MPLTASRQPTSKSFSTLAHRTTPAIVATINRDVEQRLAVLKQEVLNLESCSQPVVSPKDFLSQFKQYFQVFGEGEYLEQVVSAILGEGPFPSASECMRAVAVNALPHVSQKCPTSGIAGVPYDPNTDQDLFDFDHPGEPASEPDDGDNDASTVDLAGSDSGSSVVSNQSTLQPSNRRRLKPGLRRRTKSRRPVIDSASDSGSAASSPRKPSTSGKRLPGTSPYSDVDSATTPRRPRTQHGKLYTGYYTGDHQRYLVPPLLADKAAASTQTGPSEYRRICIYLSPAH